MPGKISARFWADPAAALFPVRRLGNDQIERRWREQFFYFQDVRMPDLGPFGQSIQCHIPLGKLSHSRLTFHPDQSTSQPFAQESAE